MIDLTAIYNKAAAMLPGETIYARAELWPGADLKPGRLIFTIAHRAPGEATFYVQGDSELELFKNFERWISQTGGAK